MFDVHIFMLAGLTNTMCYFTYKVLFSDPVVNGIGALIYIIFVKSSFCQLLSVHVSVNNIGLA